MSNKLLCYIFRINEYLFLETQRRNCKTAKNIASYEPKQHLPMLK